VLPSFPVVAVTCEDCDARLFEIDATDELLSEADADTTPA